MALIFKVQENRDSGHCVQLEKRGIPRKQGDALSYTSSLGHRGPWEGTWNLGGMCRPAEEGEHSCPCSSHARVRRRASDPPLDAAAWPSRVCVTPCPRGSCRPGPGIAWGGEDCVPGTQPVASQETPGRRIHPSHTPPLGCISARSSWAEPCPCSQTDPDTLQRMGGGWPVRDRLFKRLARLKRATTRSPWPGASRPPEGPRPGTRKSGPSRGRSCGGRPRTPPGFRFGDPSALAARDLALVGHTFPGGRVKLPLVN